MLACSGPYSLWRRIHELLLDLTNLLGDFLYARLVGLDEKN